MINFSILLEMCTRNDALRQYGIANMELDITVVNFIDKVNICSCKRCGKLYSYCVVFFLQSCILSYLFSYTTQ